MKKIICSVIISVAFFLQSNAQQYLPLFAIDSTEWIVHISSLNAADYDFMNTIKPIIDSENGDTILYADAYPFSLHDSLKISIDSLNQKAWIDLKQFNKTILAYDIGLNQSDSFLFFFADGNQLDSIYIQVDTIYTQDGRKFIEFDRDISFHPDYTSSNNQVFSRWKFTFIEGVGPINSFFYPFIFDTPYPLEIICKKDSGSIVYHSKYYSSCQLRISIQDEIPSNIDFKFDGNSVFFNNENLSVNEIKMYDLLGREMYAKSINQKYIRVDLNKINIAKGIVYVVLKIENNYFTTKILKK